MRDNDKITGLFHNRLSGSEMTVRDGFWEDLQADLSQAEAAGKDRKKPLFLSPGFYRVAAAASALLVLGIASATFWYFSPKEEIKEAFTQVAVLNPDGNLEGDRVQETFPSPHEAEPVAQRQSMRQPSGASPIDMAQADDEETDESVSVRVSITITQRMYGNQPQGGNEYYGNRVMQTGSGYRNTSGGTDTYNYSSAETEGEKSEAAKSYYDSRKWALKAAIGSSLPKGEYHAPFTAGLTVERSLNPRLALEAGLQYNLLHSDYNTIHTLAIPVRLNVTLASLSKVDLYATVGGAVEKCIAGAANNSFSAEPVQLSIAAGLGVRYRMSDRFALFAEPSVSHHFDTDSETRTLRSERPTNLNLLCGVRMTY